MSFSKNGLKKKGLKTILIKKFCKEYEDKVGHKSDEEGGLLIAIGEKDGN